MKIPFNKSFISGHEIEYMKDCISRDMIAGNGYYTQKVQDFISQNFSCPRVLLTTSGTSALEMAALLIGLKPGDEVIMPSFTFVSTANAVLLRGARPVFTEISKDTCNMDADDIEHRINEQTKAIIPVHYAGIACDMEKIIKIAREKELLVIEDAAQAVNASYDGRYLGTIGDIGAYSFHGTKNYVCGEGGALLLNLPDKNIMEEAEIIWEKGTNRHQFLRGQIDKYTWISPGSSYPPSDILAAFLYAQLEEMNNIQALREKIYKFYYNNLLAYQEKGLIKLPIIPEKARSNYHIFYLLFNSCEDRDYALYKLNSKGIGASFHYIPLHNSPMGKRLGYKEGALPVTEEVSQTLLRLPLYPHMTDSEQSYILDNLRVILDRLE